MRLLFTDFEIPYLLKDEEHVVGGACVRQYTFAKALAALGHEVGFLTWKGANQYVGLQTPFELVETYEREGGVKGLRYIYARFPAAFKAIQQYQPDFLFQITASFGVGVWSLISKILNIPFIYLVANDIDCDERIKWKLSFRERIAYQFGLRNSNLILCQNAYQQQKLKELFPYKELLIIHNPYFAKNTLQPVKPAKERSYIAWIGRFLKQKNMKALYETVIQLPEVEFKIAGKPYGTDEETVTAIKRLENCANVQFVGYLKREEILPFLSEAYALLNTSLYEGFSNVFLEALSTGTPIVTREATDPDGIIKKNNLGRVVEDYAALPSAINDLIKNSHYDELAQHCRSYVLTYHNAEFLAQEMISKLTEVHNKQKII